MASEGLEKKSIGFHVNDIVKNQGVMGLYRGFSVNFSRACVLNGTKLGCYDAIKQMIMSSGGLKDGVFLQFCSAFCAGFLMTCTVKQGGGFKKIKKKIYLDFFIRKINFYI